MKQLIQWIGFVSILSLFAGCSTPAYVVKDDSFSPGSVHTYMWVDTRASENDDSRRATAFADISVHNAVNAQLQQWGWKEVTSDPDVMISYDVLVERTTETNRDPVYTQPMVRYYYNVYRKRWTPIYYPSQFVGYQEYESPVKEGTVTITIVDARTDKKLWQGWTTERLSGSGIDDADVRRSVKNIFKEAGV
jgi:hypothetical protein